MADTEEFIIRTTSGLVRDLQEVVPFVGMSGLYEIKAPYTFALDASTEYTCVSVSSLAGLIADGRDPWVEFYEPNAGTKELYEDDLLHNRTVVTLQSGYAEVFIIPNSALRGLPVDDGIRYSTVMLGVNLGALPEHLDLTELKTDIADLVKARLGVPNIEIYEDTPSGSQIVSHENHRGIEAARQAVRSSNQSNLMRIAELQENLNAANDLRARLEAFIKANYVAPEQP